jgi:polyketide synthase 7
LVTRRTRRIIDTTDTAASVAGLAARLHGLSAEQRHRELVDMVSTNAATVLGHSGTVDIDAHKAFQDLGFDSLSAVELRNRLKSTTGLTLSPTLIFDYPTPDALAEYISSQINLAPGPSTADEPNLLSRFSAIAAELDTLVHQHDWSPEDKTHLTGRLHGLIADLNTPQTTDQPTADDDITTASESELFAILDDELGP